MSNIDKRALRKAAIHAKTVDDWGCDADNFHEKATPNAVLALLDELEAAEQESENWRTSFDNERFRADKLAAEMEARGKQIANDVQIKARLCRESNSLHDRLREAEKRIAELERSETQLIDERDNAESALNDAYKAVMGQAPEWSNWFSFADAIDEIELACGLWRNQTEDVIQFRARIAELEVKLEAADKLQDGAFRHGLQHGFSFGQTDNQAGYEQCLAAYSRRWSCE
ncbi:TPA: ead/Ea22-like family protein [Enterobacter ludwigii]